MFTKALSVALAKSIATLSAFHTRINPPMIAMALAPHFFRMPPLLAANIATDCVIPPKNGAKFLRMFWASFAAMSRMRNFTTYSCVARAAISVPLILYFFIVFLLGFSNAIILGYRTLDGIEALNQEGRLIEQSSGVRETARLLTHCEDLEDPHLEFVVPHKSLGTHIDLSGRKIRMTEEPEVSPFRIALTVPPYIQTFFLTASAVPYSTPVVQMEVRYSLKFFISPSSR